MESDKLLAERAGKGDGEAFRILYYRYRDWVYQLAWRFTGSHEDALDALQETFVYLLRKLPALELSARMTTFLYPVVKHICIDIRRKERPHQPEEAICEIAAPPAQPAGGQRSDLAAAMANLPNQQREVILMRYVDGMTMEEMAAALGTPIGTVKSRLHNGLESLRSDERCRDYFLE